MPKLQQTDHSFGRFNAIMTHNLNLFGAKAPRSTNKNAKRHPLPDGERLTYWLSGAQTKKHWSTNRTAAYLATYVEFHGGSFAGSGIPLDDGYVHPDKGVMCSLLDGKCVKFIGHTFRLTEKGWALIAPFVKASKIDKAV
jgi:hypothetical protein